MIWISLSLIRTTSSIRFDVSGKLRLSVSVIGRHIIVRTLYRPNESTATADNNVERLVSEWNGMIIAERRS